MKKILLFGIAIAFPAIVAFKILRTEDLRVRPESQGATAASNAAEMDSNPATQTPQTLKFLRQKSESLAKIASLRKSVLDRSRTEFKIAKNEYQTALKLWNANTIEIANLSNKVNNKLGDALSVKTSDLSFSAKPTHVSNPNKQISAPVVIDPQIETKNTWTPEIGILGQVTSRPMNSSELADPKIFLQNILAKRLQTNERLEVFVTGMTTTTPELRQIRKLAESQNITILRLPKIKGNRLMIRLASSSSMTVSGSASKNLE